MLVRCTVHPEFGPVHNYGSNCRVCGAWVDYPGTVSGYYMWSSAQGDTPEENRREVSEWYRTASLILREAGLFQ